MTDLQLPIWRRWWFQAALAGCFTVIAWVTQVVLGEDAEPLVRWLLIVSGALSALLAFYMPLRYARRQEVEKAAAIAEAESAVSGYRLRTNDILTPLVRLVSEIASEVDPASKDDRQQRLRQMAVDFALKGNAASRWRACFFHHIPGNPQRFRCDIAAGRNTKPSNDIVETTDRGQAVIRLLNSRKSRLVADAHTENVEGYDRASDQYRSFICTPVLAGKFTHGLLMLDCPEPNGFDENDQRDLELIALILASGLSA